MHLVIFGLTVSSSWGNGHATLWRSLIKAMLRRGHTVSFYERDLPYYASARDLHNLPSGGNLYVYNRLDDIRANAKRDLAHADLALCTSYCPDGAAAGALILESRATIKAFYDLDTPVTLDALGTDHPVEYLPSQDLGQFDLVLSYTGGRALEELKSRLGARVVAPLYGSVDPENHYPVPPCEEFRSALSYLGTYAPDRQVAFDRLFLESARRIPKNRFLVGGAQYPGGLAWTSNVTLLHHIPPPDHPAFFCSSRATLNITREAMARYGYCPQGRLFEAAACGTPLLTDDWEGLDTFFLPGEEVLRVTSPDDVVNALSLSDIELRHIAECARARALSEHTGEHRVQELEAICNSLRSTASEAIYQ
jgi:spore maturation protein CgeB